MVLSEVIMKSHEMSDVLFLYRFDLFKQDIPGKQDMCRASSRKHLLFTETSRDFSPRHMEIPDLT
jgi:hypothetical protein